MGRIVVVKEKLDQTENTVYCVYETDPMCMSSTLHCAYTSLQDAINYANEVALKRVGLKGELMHEAIY